MSEKDAQIKVVVTIEDESFECDLSQDLGTFLNFENPVSFLKTYILRTCDNVKVLKALAKGQWYREQLVYNNNIGSQIADTLVEELDYKLSDGRYLETYYILLSNPSISGKKLNELTYKHLSRYYKRKNQEWYLDSDMLKAIARNPSTQSSTLYLLRHCGIEKVENAAKRD